MNQLADNAPSSSLSTKVENLEASIKKLILLCGKLSDENISLKQNHQQLMHERADLQTKNDKVRMQIEAMVERLKTAEKAS